jgi:hypothetical protein
MAAPDTALSLTQASSRVDGKAYDSPALPGVDMRAKALTLHAEDGSGVRAPSTAIEGHQTFGALGGSRHVELQAKPCVFGSDCSAIFYDEVHDSIITIQPSDSRKPGLPFAPLHHLSLSSCSLLLQATRYPPSLSPAMKRCENFSMQNPRCQFL